jgi:hypothetical protein
MACCSLVAFGSFAASGCPYRKSNPSILMVQAA